MKVQKRQIFKTCRYAGILSIVLLGLVSIIATSDSDSGSIGTSSGEKEGVFIDSPVEGLSYETPTWEGRTNQNGAFTYNEGETVTFSIGGLELGSAGGDEVLTPLDLVPESDPSDPPDAAINISRLLQTLDEDGDLNNGIRISSEIESMISDVVSDEGPVIFDQDPETFKEDTAVGSILESLNEAGVFTDADPRARTLRTAADAQEHLTRNLSKKKTVSTEYGELQGYAPNENTWQWLGVPYAKPPVEDLRWRPPQDPEPWDGVRQATSWGDQAAQPPNYEQHGQGGMSEDCLYLNITAPKDAENLPVMVWFHGGGFQILTGNTRAFNNPESLPTKDVVLVTVNHRLGPFGYMAHPLLTEEAQEEADYEGSGNYGQMDLVKALEWVQGNIEAFGGNPENVTIFGESGGGMKSISLMASEEAQGLFDRVICESGMSPAPTPDLETAQRMGETVIDELAEELEITDPDLEDLRAAPWSAIATLDSTSYGNDEVSFGPNIDNHYYTKTLEQSVQEGLPNDVPMISGINTDDYPNLIDGFLELMPVYDDNNDGPYYAYLFSHVPSGWADKEVGAYHAIELIYVFNYPGSFYSHYLLGLPDLEVDDTKTPEKIIDETGYGEEDVVLTDTVMSIWASFARDGDPNVDGVAEWMPYTSGAEDYLEIKPTPEADDSISDVFAE